MKKAPLALAALLALAGAAAPAASSASAAPAPAGQLKKVGIVVDLAKSPIACSVDADEVSLSKAAKDRVKWAIPPDIKKLGPKLTITWYAGSPFAKGAGQSPDGDWDSGDVAPAAGEKSYAYGFTLKLKDGRTCMVDPRIVIVP